MIELDKLSLEQIIGEEIELIPLMNEEDEKSSTKKLYPKYFLSYRSKTLCYFQE